MTLRIQRNETMLLGGDGDCRHIVNSSSGLDGALERLPAKNWIDFGSRGVGGGSLAHNVS
jgi:hypothetical protein